MGLRAVAEEFLAGKGLVHQAVTGGVLVQQADQGAPQRQAGDEALGAVDRVEHPDIFGLCVHRAEFLADHPVMRKGFADQAAHRGFGRAVGLGDRIEDAAGGFVLHREGGAEEGHDRFARNLRQAVHEWQEIHRRHLAAPHIADFRLTRDMPRSGALKRVHWRGDRERVQEQGAAPTKVLDRAWTYSRRS